jgi:hypothetical protein
LQAKGPAFEQPEQRVDFQAILAEKVDGFGKDGFTNEQGRPYLLHDGDGPGVIRVAPVEIGDQRARIADGSHGRRNLRRLFDAGRRPPAKLPARSAVSAKTDSPA